MIRKLALALCLALLASPAWAVSPSYSGAGSGEGRGEFAGGNTSATGIAFNVSAGDLILVPIFVEVPSGSVPSIVIVANDVTPLDWRRRTFKTGTVAQHSGAGSCIGRMELWWAYAPAAITATHVRVTISGAADATTWYVNRYQATFAASRPFDGNIGLPVAITNNTGGIAPTATIPNTTQPDDLALGFTAYCSGELANVAGTGVAANNAFQGTISASNYNTQGSVSKSVSTPQTSLAMPFGNILAAPAGFFFIADALTNDAPPPKSGATSASVGTDIVISSGSGAPPPQASVAGFTQLVLNADFSRPFYATASNWLDCAGATNPEWWIGYPGFPGINGPCNAIHQAIDPLIGQPVLQIVWQDSYWANNGNVNLTQIGTVNINNTTHLFPPFLYLEVVARSDVIAATRADFDLWTIGFTVPPFANEGFELDGIEIYSTAGSDSAFHNNVDGSGAFLGNYPPGNDIDTTQYHTYAWRLTSDGSTKAVYCAYIDGSSTIGGQPNACISINATANQVAGSTPQGLYLVIGQGLGCPALPTPCTTGTTNLWVKSVRVWSCAGYDSGQKCFSSSANP